MRTFELGINKAVYRLHPVELSRDARRRLRWMEWYAGHGRNARATCRHFTISPSTFYLWKRRFDGYGPASLEDVSRRPKRVREPTWSRELEDAVLELRQLTGWGKDKLVVLLRDQGWACSTSMVGRILKRLHKSARLVEAPGADPWIPRRPFLRPYGVRKPREYLPDSPGAIVQVDTAHVALYNGFRFKHFTACDVFTRWQVLEAHGRATAHAAAGFLDTILERMPFPVKAIQVDGGSEFMAQFEEACRERGIHLFVLPPPLAQTERPRRTCPAHA
jgi:transposase